MKKLEIALQDGIKEDMMYVIETAKTAKELQILVENRMSEYEPIGGVVCVVLGQRTKAFGLKNDLEYLQTMKRRTEDKDKEVQ